ncbi:hypothetical protein FE783_23435 [Paenibacillus mesophilus]|uniref:VanW family protein n=1 Tax=Paenibacillus mesophilus TaxID=2582849 RepID=UPI00110D4BFC|nr:VanW family protein [Paenibacillus mesophilus]TMV47194.1 hypothetical protein FE783_23435 [Paenibacillus mesophilus]
MNRQLANRLMLIAVAGIVALWIWFWWYSGQRTVPQGVRLGEWSVGGMPEEQFRLELKARLTQLYGEPVRFEMIGGDQEKETFTLGQLGLSAEERRLSKLADYLFEGDRLTKAKRRWHLRNTVLPFELSLSDDMLRKTLTAAWPARMNPPVKNAERTVTADDRIMYTPEQRAHTVDISRLAERLIAVGYELFYAAGHSDAAKAPAPATIVQVPMREQLPEVTLEMLKAQGINRKISEFTTYFPGSVPGRVHNIQATAATVHDKLLAPGERFDYGTIIRATEQKVGYREAPVILNGKLVPGIGGGICQVSTTLYNAVLLAGLKVNERRNHSLPVSYVPLGQDATYADGYINFMFTNSTEHYLWIRTESDANRVTVKLFGTTPESVTYEVESNILQTLEPPVKYVRNPTLQIGEQSILQQGKPGYVVETFRIRKENGVVVGKERLSQDKYQPQPSLIAVHGSDAAPDGKDAPPGGRSIIEDGVFAPVFPKGR